MNVQRTYVDVTLALDHTEAFDDDALAAAVSVALPGLTLATGEALHLSDGTVSRHSAIIEDVTEIWVKGPTA